MKGDFIQNLGKIYGLYTGGFLLFIILMAILEQARHDRLSVRRLHHRDLCADRRAVAHHADRSILCRGPTGSGTL